MTKEERIGTMAAAEATINEGIEKYNKALSNKGTTAETLEKIEDAISDALDVYNTQSKYLMFDTCKAADDPMLKAVEELVYPTLGVKLEEDKDAGTSTLVKKHKTQQIDLLKLYKHCGQIGKNTDWRFMIEKFNFLMTAKIAKEIRPNFNLVSLSDSYAMHDIARDYDLGKNPCSNTQMLKTLQSIITAMIGEQYKALSHDVKYLNRIYSKKGRAALSVSCANHTRFRGYIMEICHRIVTGKEYDLEYKMKKRS